MKNVEQRAKFDDYELEDNYDFSDGIRGRFYKSKKYARRYNWIMIFCCF
ncbi:MAG: hypothetical protein QX199_18635 [Methylococcaceae bacterium]